MGSESSKNTRSSNEDFFPTTSKTRATSSNDYQQRPVYQTTLAAKSAQSAYTRPAEQPPLVQYQRAVGSTSTARIYPTLNEQPLDIAACQNYYDYMKNQQAATRITPSAPPEHIVNTDPPKPTNFVKQTSAAPRETKEKKFFPKIRPPPATRNNSTNDGFNCPTCKKPYGIRIFQCLRGHSCCEDCKTKAISCGICNLAIDPDKRNFSLEDTINKLQAPCENASNGCQLSIKRIDMEAHLEECPYSVRPCPLQMMGLAQCNWKGKLTELKEHFDVVHPNNRMADAGKEMTISNFSVFATLNHRFIHLIDLNTFYFILYLSIDSEKVSMAVQFCGTNVSAGKWNYEVHVYNKQNPRKKYFFTDICKAYNSPLSEIATTGAVLPKFFAEGFLDSDTLTYKVYIKKQNGNGWRNQRGGPRNESRSNAVNSNRSDV